MIKSQKMRTALHTVAVALPLLGGLFLAVGCDPDGYPTELRYPPRRDPIVNGKPTQDSPHIDLPGQFPELFVGLSSADKARILIDPVDKVKPDQREQLEAALGKLFGTPLNPRVANVPEDARQLLMLDDATLAEGSLVYRHQCLHCHGLSGNGQGPTGPWVNPHPRDFRPGRFKFTSTNQSEGERKARREDLIRTLREGIEGASMPSFRLLSDRSLNAVASYVIHLSLRGQVEEFAMKELAEGNSPTAPEELLEGILGQWIKAQSSAIKPGPYGLDTPELKKEAVVRGWKLFKEPGDAGCIACHTDYGRLSPWKYDAWGTMVKPTDLTRGVYRGGRRPIDLYFRIDQGINGAGMTAFGASLKPNQIWDLVSFLQVLPYPKMRQAYGVEVN